MHKLEMIRDELHEYQATLEQYRELLFETVGPAINDLQDRLAEALNLIELNFHPVVILSGGFTTAKSSLLSRFLPQPLPSGAMPTSRIFALVCPTKGVTKVAYSVVHLGIAEVRRLLRLLAANLHEDVARHAKAIARKPIHPKVMARELLDLILEKINPRLDVADRRVLAEAAFLCRSVCEHFNTDEKTAWSEELSNSPFQAAADKAEQFLSWGVDAEVASLIYKPGEPTSRQALQAELEDWFIKKSRLNAFRQSPNFDQIKERYDITLRLATLGYVQINVPQNEGLADGLVWVDSPGHGASLHDTIKAQVCTESAIGGMAFVNLRSPWGKEDENVLARLQSRNSLNAIAFTFADDPLAGKVSEHLRNLACLEPENAQKSLQTILAEFASLTSISRQDSIVRQWLGSDDVRDVNRVLLCCPIFGLPDQAVYTEICKKALPLARFLRDASTLKNLPDHLQKLVSESAADGLSPLSFPEIESLPPVVAQRLTALIFALANDGGMGHAAAIFGSLNETLNAGVDPRIARLQGILENLRDLISRMTVGEQGAVRVQLPPKLERVVRDAVQHVSDLASAFLQESHQNVPVRRLLHVPHRICTDGEPAAGAQGALPPKFAEMMENAPSATVNPKMWELLQQFLQSAGMSAPADARPDIQKGILPKQLKIAAQEMTNEGPNRTFREVARERFQERFVKMMLRYIQPEVADEVGQISDEYEALLQKHFEPVLGAASAEHEEGGGRGVRQRQVAERQPHCRAVD